MALNASQKRQLRSAAHELKPVVMIGQNGYTASIVAAVDEALNDHELIKIRLRGIEKENRRSTVDEICRDLDAEFVALVGAVATIYRPRPPES